jgi:hypothetical protein
MDALRARAFLDLLLGTDSRPLGAGTAGTPGTTGAPNAPRTPNAPGTGEAPAPTGPLAGVVPPGFAGRVTLTIPATTILDLADRPGELPGIGPVDPDLARDLATAAARHPGPPGASPSPTARATPSATAAPGPHRPPAVTTGADRAPPAGLIPRAHPGSPSPPPASPARPAGTGPGGSPPGSPGSATCSSRSGRSRPGTATTGTRPKAMIPGSCCGTWPRSGTLPAPGPAAAGLLNAATSSTTPRTRPAAGPACATGTRSAASTSTQAGRAMEGRTAAQREHPLDHALRTAVRHRTHPLPDLRAYVRSFWILVGVSA